MRLGRPGEVPWTGAVSGVVFVLALVNFDGAAMFRNETLLFAAWGLLYIVESVVRSQRQSWPVSGTPRADLGRAPLRADRSPDATDDAGT
jgi:hypothetical protein